MKFLQEVIESVFHLAFPHVCAGCCSDVLDEKDPVCLRCQASLPSTDFHLYPDNAVEKIFWGRLEISQACALYYFSKESLMQRLMHEFKYRGNKDLGFYLGRQIGHALHSSGRFRSPDLLLPLPLFRDKEKKRGFNQAAILAEGISSVLMIPVETDLIIRTTDTESQTRKGRRERWQNMEGRFRVTDQKALEGKHVLLIDDVITTGATLEACGRALTAVPGLRLSITALCFSSGN